MYEIKGDYLGGWRPKYGMQNFYKRICIKRVRGKKETKNQKPKNLSHPGNE